VLSDGSLYTQLKGDQTLVVRLDAKSGAIIWRRNYPWVPAPEGSGIHQVGPVAVAGAYAFGIAPTGWQETDKPDGTGILYPPPAALYCWRARDGQPLWQQPADWPQWWANPLLAWNPGTVAFSDGETTVAYQAESGGVVWKLGGQEHLGPPWALYGGDILMSGSRGGHAVLARVGAHDGRVKWRLDLRGIDEITSIVPVPGASRVYVTGDREKGDQQRLYVVGAARMVSFDGRLTSRKKVARPREGDLGLKVAGNATNERLRH
jgi:outer membrane protein assembly factor BamB